MVDLHTHTSSSDGLYTARELIAKAEELDIRMLGITDHDTVAAFSGDDLQSLSETVRVVPGVEISCSCETGDLHMLGYQMDLNDSELIDTLLYYQKQRENRIHRILAAFNDNGMAMSYDDLGLKEGDTSPGKPHIARILIAKGYVKDQDEAFKRFLGKGQIGDVPKEKLDVDKAIGLITKAGGLAVLAHPVSLNLTHEKLKSRILELTAMGMGGLEIYANMHSDADVSFFKQLALDEKLLPFGGSDYHGEKKSEHLGYYGDNRVIPDSIAASISGL